MPANRIILASASPRRAELLQQINVEFDIDVADIDETHTADETAAEFVQRLAQEKALAVASRYDDQPVILAADTVVVVDRQILGKPDDFQQAMQMLQMLSATTHQVMTAVCVHAKGEIVTALSQSAVSFRKLHTAEIKHYWETGEPCDKAGAYAIQGLGAVFIENLQGSYSGVMGLPLYETAALLNNVGIKIMR